MNNRLLRGIPLVLALAALAACSERPSAPVAPEPEAPSASGRLAGPPLRIDIPTMPTVPLQTAYSGGTILVENFSDPLSAWRTRFMGLHSNLNNYYFQYNSCWGPVSGGECRGNNWDGLWIADNNNADRNSYIRFDAAFAASLHYFSIDIGSHIGGTLRVYDKNLALLLSTSIPYGCSNCSYNNPGGNIYHNFSVSSTNGIGGFDILGSYVEGNVGIDNVVVHQGPTNRAPTASAGPDQTVECTGATTSVTLNGSGSSDPDGDALTYSWSWTGGSASGASPTVSLPDGSHAITLTVSDGKGGTDTDVVVVTIVDTTPPTLSFSLSTTELWPPNHNMVTVAQGVSATDVCDSSATVAITVTSNEPDNGLGDGDTAGDWAVIDNGNGTYDIQVRAERGGKGTGRVYTIAVTATDDSGNSTSASGQVKVPHSKGK